MYRRRVLRSNIHIHSFSFGFLFQFFRFTRSRWWNCRNNWCYTIWMAHISIFIFAYRSTRIPYSIRFHRLIALLLLQHPTHTKKIKTKSIACFATHILLSFWWAQVAMEIQIFTKTQMSVIFYISASKKLTKMEGIEKAKQSAPANLCARILPECVESVLVEHSDLKLWASQRPKCILRRRTKSEKFSKRKTEKSNVRWKGRISFLLAALLVTTKLLRDIL